MKKIFYLASIAALAFSSCAKDETTEAALDVVKGGSKIVAAMEADDTRTELVKNGNAYDIVWKSTDGLSVYEKGGNGVVSAFSNRLFQLDNASDGLASGAFTGSKLTAGGTYVAVYPYDKAYSFTPNWNEPYYKYAGKTYTMLDPESITVNIPETQEYVGSGTFNTNTIPAISTEFVVGEDGNATVKMQPVVDYVMVDIAATENIKSVSLVLYDGPNFTDANKVIPIAGTTNLEAYYANGGIRYVTANDGLDKSSITLVTKDLADDVSLAKANTYVFAIPGQILGMGQDVNWVLWVDNGAGNAPFMTSSATYNTNETNVTAVNNGSINTQLNEYAISSSATASRVHYGNYNTYDYHYVGGAVKAENNMLEYASNLENTVFYLNKAGKPFVYNPEEEAIIRNELDLIEYIVDYEVEPANAYVAENAVFDLSVANLSKILSEADIRAKHPALYAAINGYIAGTSSFPVIAEYNHEFKGNGAAITNIEKPLASIFGLFGELGANAKISNLTLSNIVAATAVEGKGELDGQEDYNGNKVKKETVKGVVLANVVANKQISNITVSNLDADAVVGSGNLNNYNAIKIGEAGLNNKLNHVMQTINLDGNLTYKAEAWDAVSVVNESVFNTIVPTPYTSNGNNVSHVIATLPEGAKYEAFVEKVDNSVAANVLSVLIGETSFWTGGKIANNVTVEAQYYPSNMGTYKSHTAIRYAEELAGAYAANAKLYLVRNIDMNYANNNTSWTTNANVWAELYGAGNTIKGLTMVSKDGAEKNIGKSLAPFQVKTIANANFDGIDINVVTKAGFYAVPMLISGLSNDLVTVKNVNVKNVQVMGSSENDVQKDEPHYLAGSQVWLGWLSATATDIEVNNVTIDGAKTNLSAFSGAVATLTLDQLTSWFNDFSISNIVAHSKATSLADFEAYEVKVVNVKGTAVGNVSMISDSVAKSSVKFDNSGSPKFTYNITGADKNAYINVLYNDTVVETLRHPDYEE